MSNAPPGGNVTIYPAGATTPSRTLPVDSPVGVAPDRRGRLYVSTRNSTPSILVFRPESNHPFETITSSLLQVPSQIAFDRDGVLYITDNNTGVLALQDGTTAVTSLNLTGLPSCPTGITVDHPKQELFVSGCLGGTLVYPFGQTAPSRSLDESFPADNIAMGKLGTHRVLFAPDIYSGTVTLYQAKDNEPLETFSTGAGNPVGIAFKPGRIP